MAGLGSTLALPVEEEKGKETAKTWRCDATRPLGFQSGQRNWVTARSLAGAVRHDPGGSRLAKLGHSRVWDKVRKRIQALWFDDEGRDESLGGDGGTARDFPTDRGRIRCNSVR